jgi:hypothetical protein
MAGKGYFERVSAPDTQSASDPNTYVLTPKYNDPYSGDSERKIARFRISPELLAAIQSSIGGADSTTSTLNISGNRILNKLANQNRGYFDFFLEGTDETFDEKFQVVETLGDSYAVFGLGKKPFVWSFTGSLLNSQENEWRINFIRMFEKYLSISRLASFRSGTRDNQVSLIYDGMVAKGALLNLRTQLRAKNELATTFAFSMLVTKLTSTSNLSVATTTDETDETQSAQTKVIQHPENKEATIYNPDALSANDRNRQVAFNKDIA